MNREVVVLPFDVELLPVKKLKSGKLDCVYENGNLRYIKFGDVEILRMIYAAVRDENWNTASYKIENENIEDKDDGFIISFTALYKLGNIDYTADFMLQGEGDSISVSMKGEARSSFKKNRIGLCVHHPLKECSGKEAEIDRPDGSRYVAVFPGMVSPHQPFLEVRKLSWQPAAQVKCELTFEGDVFETEDQRNWSDSSYKTYSTPLYLPFPVFVQKGARISQKITLKVTPPDPEVLIQAKASDDAENKFALPKIGFSRYPGQQLSLQDISQLKEVPFSRYRVELRIKNSWQEELRLAAAEAKYLNAGLELVVFFTASVEEEVSMIVDEIKTGGYYIQSILPLREQEKTTTTELLQVVYPILKKIGPDTKIGWGTDLFFADLNRNRPPSIHYDFVSFSLNPQVHLSDTRTIIENLDAQRDIITTIKSFCQGKEIHVSPITLNQRLNESEDERVHTFFGAWWILASIENLSQAGSITLFHGTGPNGVLRFGDRPSPLYKVLSQVKQFGPMWIKKGSDHGTIVFEKENGHQLCFQCNAFVN